jgi:hypothetical protein
MIAAPLQDYGRDAESHRRYVLGEHIIVGEIPKNASKSVRWHDVDCADLQSLSQYSEILPGASNTDELACRHLVMDDFSPRALHVLGQNFRIDPRVFMNHLHQSLEDSQVEQFNTFRNPRAGCRSTQSVALAYNDHPVHVR